MNPNRDSLALLAVESVCMLGKLHQLIWQWPIAGELEVGDSNQLVLAKISCPGGGDPYWLTAHDIPDDDKWGEGWTFDAVNKKNTCGNLMCRARVCRCRCSSSFCADDDWLVPKIEWKHKNEGCNGRLVSAACVNTWVRTVDPGTQESRGRGTQGLSWRTDKSSLCFTVIHSCCSVYYSFYISMNLLHVIFEKL